MKFTAENVSSIVERISYLQTLTRQSRTLVVPSETILLEYESMIEFSSNNDILVEVGQAIQTAHRLVYGPNAKQYNAFQTIYRHETCIN